MHYSILYMYLRDFIFHFRQIWWRTRFSNVRAMEFCRLLSRNLSDFWGRKRYKYLKNHPIPTPCRRPLWFSSLFDWHLDTLGTVPIAGVAVLDGSLTEIFKLYRSLLGKWIKLISPIPLMNIKSHTKPALSRTYFAMCNKWCIYT